ncbi:MAG: PAS domain S-box protein, partial [Thermotogota bacterium]
MENLDQYKSIFNNSSDAIYFHIVNKDGILGNFCEVNDAACEMLGYTREEFLEMTPDDIDSSDSLKNSPDIINKLMQHKQVIFEAVHTKKNGEQIPVEINATLVEVPEGVKVISIARNISERKKNEEELKLYKEIVSTINDPMAVVDKDYKYKLVNGAYSDFYQSTIEEIVGKRVDDFLDHIHFEKEVKPGLDRCFSGEMVEYATWVAFPGGVDKFMAMTYYPHYSPEGEVLGCISHGKDLTKEKRLEMNLEESQTLFRSIINTMPGTLNVMDADYNLLALNANRIKLDMIDYDSIDELIGKKCYKVFQNRQTPCPWCKIERVLKTGETIIETTTPDDSREKLTGKALKIFLSPVKNKAGDTLGAIEYGLDVTELRNAQLKAEHLTENKSRILATMSHEVKNQLNGIIGFSEVLKNLDLDEEKVGFVDNIVRSGQNLLKIVNDSLLISKMEAGKLEITKVDTDIRQIAKQAVEVVEQQAKHKGNRIQIEMTDDIPELVQTDPLRVSQVLINLLSNANKFTQNGNIRLKLEKIGEKEQLDKIRFAVTDTGIGIQKEQQEKIFEAFQQTGNNTHEESEGTGLGLSISNGLLQLMGSQLVLESTPGKGSTFSFELYMKRVKRQKKVHSHGMKNVTLGLIADDDEVSRMLAEMLLKEIIPGVKVLKAINGKQALEAYELHHPDFILMDVQMPLMDGLDVTRHIREKEAGERKTTIIGYSATAYEKDIQKALDTGMDDYVNKPLVKEDLIKILKN